MGRFTTFCSHVADYEQGCFTKSYYLEFTTNGIIFPNFGFDKSLWSKGKYSRVVKFFNNIYKKNRGKEGFSYVKVLTEIFFFFSFPHSLSF